MSALQDVTTADFRATALAPPTAPSLTILKLNTKAMLSKHLAAE
jgi:hypothetical protein